MTKARSGMVARALAFAANAHGTIGQRRKYTNEPYIEHPVEVMQIVESVAHTEEMLVAALLHDTIEDTPVTREDIAAQFGADVAALVMELTDQCHEGNRATRKAAEAERLAQISPAAQTIKLADLISNTRSIIAHDPDFSRIYLREKVHVLSRMRAGDPGLYALASSLVREASVAIGLELK